MSSSNVGEGGGLDHNGIPYDAGDCPKTVCSDYFDVDMAREDKHRSERKQREIQERILFHSDLVLCVQKYMRLPARVP